MACENHTAVIIDSTEGYSHTYHHQSGKTIGNCEIHIQQNIIIDYCHTYLSISSGCASTAL